MPLIDAGYFLTSNAYVYTAPVGTAKPAATAAALATPDAAWVLLGHLGTEAGDGMPEFGLNGGDVTPKGSMSKKQIRTITAAVTREIDFNLTQFTRDALALYYGSNGGAVDGYFDVQGVDDGNSTEKALLFTFRDGTNWVGFWAGRASISGQDSIKTEKPEDAIAVPLKAIALDPATGSDPRYSWISPALLNHS